MLGGCPLGRGGCLKWGPELFHRAGTTQWLVVSPVSLEWGGGDEIHAARMPVLWLDVVSPSESKLLL